MAPSHYLNQCWLIISEGLSHSPEGNFIGNNQDIYPWHEFESYKFKTTALFPRVDGLKVEYLIICIICDTDLVNKLILQVYTLHKYK